MSYYTSCVEYNNLSIFQRIVCIFARFKRPLLRIFFRDSLCVMTDKLELNYSNPIFFSCSFMHFCEVKLPSTDTISSILFPTDVIGSSLIGLICSQFTFRSWRSIIVSPKNKVASSLYLAITFCKSAPNRIRTR
jgi:hypothetical protein